ncbi:MAG: cell division FtsA domain-containing protein [Erysipelotrichaceae bacterium]|nr:cell division FtsA domain-containing protein [Erysipelotrichaceae bacterium]
MRNIYALLDIGSATIKLVVAEVLDTNVNVLYADKTASHGISKGYVANEEIASEDVKKIVAKANDYLGTTIGSVALIIPTIGSRIYQSDSSISLSDSGSKITSNDIRRILDLSARFKKEADEELVSVIPICFHHDQGSNNKVPLDIKSRNLAVDSLVVTSPKKLLYPFLRVVENAGLDILDVSISAYACALEAFDEAYMNEGSILVDVGFKTSTISFYKDGYLKYLSVVPYGGNDFTRNIYQNFQISPEQGETYKIKYGSVFDRHSKDDIVHTVVYDDEKKDYSLADLHLLDREIAKAIFTKIKEKVELIDQGNNYEIILVGGGSELKLIPEVASQVLNAPVRLYRPETIGVRDMAYVSCLGMIYFMINKAKYQGGYEPSLVLDEITNTMSVRLKGLTRNNPAPQKGVNKILENLFNDE